jgi:hypothetical protein
VRVATHRSHIIRLTGMCEGMIIAERNPLACDPLKRCYLKIIPSLW